MRLGQKLDVILKFLLVELGILFLIGVVFYFQFDKAKEEFVTKTRAVAETIGEQASSYFSDYGKEPTSDEFYMFLDQRLGRKKLFNTFEISPKFFSVVFKKDVENGTAGGYFMNDFYSDEGVSVKRDKGLISVSVPFMTQQESQPSGIVKIDSDTKTLIKKVFSDNFLLYAAMLIVLNNQAFILYLFTRRKKEVVFDKGYLKDHSIGALKIMHRVLGDIIEDHASEEDKKSEDEKTQQEKKTSSKRSDLARNVISISRLASKKDK